MQFYKLSLGARFEFEGKRYRKTGMDVAECDDDGTGGMIRREWEVSPIGEPLLLPEEEAEKWKPIYWQHWADRMMPSPIENGDWVKTHPRW